MGVAVLPDKPEPELQRTKEALAKERQRIWRALLRYRETGNPRAALRDLGLVKGARGKRYDDEHLLDLYETLLSDWQSKVQIVDWLALYADGLDVSLAKSPELRDEDDKRVLRGLRESPSFKTPMIPADAVRVVADVSGLSPKACRNRLSRQRGRNRKRGLPADFELPSETEL